jgi:hypothetical protein
LDQNLIRRPELCSRMEWVRLCGECRRRVRRILGPVSRHRRGGSTNSGLTVSAISTASTNGDTVFALVLNPFTNDLWMGTEQNGIFRSTDNGLN